MIHSCELLDHVSRPYPRISSNHRFRSTVSLRGLATKKGCQSWFGVSIHAVLAAPIVSAE